MPARAAPDPLLAGWTRVDDLHYVAPEDADAYAQGLVRVGADLVPRAQPLPTETPVEGGHVLRTDHVLLRTNVSYELALDVAREAELHVQRVFEAWGEALDIRFPADAVVVLLMATREEFAMHLAHRVAEPVGWGAFYDATTGIVNVCAEPAPRGALPWTADLRHEMTHQLLDLSRPPRRRVKPSALRGSGCGKGSPCTPNSWATRGRVRRMSRATVGSGGACTWANGRHCGTSSRGKLVTSKGATTTRRPAG